MDTEQIQQQMRNRRAAIDGKLDLLAGRVLLARRRIMPAVIAVASVAGALVAIWVRKRNARKAVLARMPRLKAV